MELKQMFMGDKSQFTRNIANISENIGTDEKYSSDGEIDEIEKLLMNSSATTMEQKNL